jgi:hypothetical protein
LDLGLVDHPTTATTKGLNMSETAVHLNRDEHFNGISFQEYRALRSSKTDIEAMLLDKSALSSSEVGGSPFRLSYELQMAGHNLEQQALAVICNRAWDLVKIFPTIAKYWDWYNTPSNELVAVEHPRKLNFHCYDDLYGIRADNGIIVGIENQMSSDLTLVDSIDWYGGPVLCAVPLQIEKMATAYFDITTVFTTAARGVKYRLEGTDWYMYIAVYTYSLGGNYIYVELSTKAIPWNELYYKLSERTSTSRPEGCPAYMSGSINYQSRARAVVQIASTAFTGVVATITDWMDKRWRTPADDAKQDL